MRNIPIFKRLENDYARCAVPSSSVQNHARGEFEMRNIGLLCGAITAAVLAGCGGMQTMNAGGTGGATPLAGFECNFAVDCVVYVHVTDTNPCVISVDKPEIVMKGSETWTAVKHLIRWEMDEASDDAKFRFDSASGVVRKSPDQNGQFSGQSPQGGGKQYHWRDKNTNYATYGYDINVFKKTNPAIKCRLDPRIINN
jgi:hypothetical protein